jgi:hypothetical protein
MPDENSGTPPPEKSSGDPLPIPQSTQPNPSPAQQRMMSNNGAQDSKENEAATSKSIQDVHWIQHATFWSQIGLGLIGVVALWIYHGQLCVMKKQLDQMSAQSTQITQQTTLLRKQIVGTQGAYIEVIPGFQHSSEAIGFTGYEVADSFQNGGSVYATDFDASVTLTEISIPKFSIIGKPKVIALSRKIFAPHDAVRFGYDSVYVATFHLNDFTDLEMDKFRKLTRTFEISAKYSYGDGFGNTVTNTSCRVYGYILGPNGSVQESWYDCEEGREIISRLGRAYQNQ